DRVITLSLTILVLIIVSSIIWPQQFFSLENLSLVLLNLSIDAIVAVGMMILLISGAFDLSVGSVVAFAGGFAAYLMFYWGVYVPVAILAALAVSLVIGFINGWLVASVGINPLIQTLAMMGIVRGLALMVSGSGIQNLPDGFNALGQARFLGFQLPVWYMIAVVIIFSFLVARTIFFRRYYYIGGNEKAALLSGIRVGRMKIYSFMLMSFLAGLAGIILAARLGAGMPTTGQGLELKVITAVILGGASLLGGQGKIVGALLGTLFMGIVANIMILARVSGYWQQIIFGIILIFAVAIDLILQKRADRAAISLVKVRERNSSSPGN
ncbi:MAG: ABC transporter permease, partial [Saprospiraceae bacterium]|nr:ABC transporter permease [Saprospiraceae bacterium]